MREKCHNTPFSVFLDPGKSDIQKNWFRCNIPKDVCTYCFICALIVTLPIPNPEKYCAMLLIRCLAGCVLAEYSVGVKHPHSALCDQYQYIRNSIFLMVTGFEVLLNPNNHWLVSFLICWFFLGLTRTEREPLSASVPSWKPDRRASIYNNQKCAMIGWRLGAGWFGSGARASPQNSWEGAQPQTSPPPDKTLTWLATVFITGIGGGVGATAGKSSIASGVPIPRHFRMSVPAKKYSPSG